MRRVNRTDIYHYVEFDNWKKKCSYKQKKLQVCFALLRRFTRLKDLSESGNHEV
jgi:hypothetical protein